MPHEDVTLNEAMAHQRAGNTLGTQFEAIGSWWVEGDDKAPFPASGITIASLGIRGGGPAVHMDADDDGTLLWCTPVGGADSMCVRWVKPA